MAEPELPGPAAALPAAGRDIGAAEPPPLCLQLSVWTRGRWRARAAWGDGQERWFDSPFELARFLAHPPMPSAAAQPAGGLR